MPRPRPSTLAFGSFVAVSALRLAVARADDLADLATQMQPGTWAELPQTNAGAVLGQGTHDGNMLPYSMRGIWDAAGGTLYYVGGDHGEPALKLFSYEAATNTWHDLGVTPLWGHGYDHLTIDPTNRVLYHRQYGIADDGNHVWQWPIASSGPWTQIESWPIAGYIQVAIGADWFVGLDGAGPAGALVVYNCGQPDGELVFWDPTDTSWFDDVQGFGGETRYHCVIEYSAVHNVAVLGGGGASSKNVWRLNADRSVTPLTDAPIDLGIQAGNIVPDPGTGNFIVMAYGELWELDPTGAGTWTPLGGPATPPAGVGNPGSPDLDSVISAEIADYGVDLYVTCQANDCKVHLYKHTDAPVAPRGSTSSSASGTSSASSGSGGPSSSASGTGGAPVAASAGAGGATPPLGATDDAAGDDGACACSDAGRRAGAPATLMWLGLLVVSSSIARRRRNR